jgi:hypothetical protein
VRYQIAARPIFIRISFALVSDRYAMESELKRTYCVLICALCFAMPVFAAPASDDAIHALLESTHARKVFDEQLGQIVSLMDQAAVSALQGKHATARQQKAIDHMKAQMVSLLQAELDWAKIEPLYVQLYRESFSDEEIAGMLAFYQSPTGQSVVLKMPGLLQKTVGAMQDVLLDVMPRMQNIQQEFADQMQAGAN